ncbi:Phosphoribosylaminoimidazole-succinocarboxamide synthase [Candidatus Magnetomoraceae bacterium gMMP-15]
MKKSVHKTNFPKLNLLQRGKVRDIYDMDDALLMIASDRLSAFDVVLPDPIPDKGKILTQISLFWFEMMEPLIKNHVITSNIEEYPEVCKPYAEILKDRSMLVKKSKPLPVECVVRGYISGSGWKSYQKTQKVCGIKLPENLKESEKLPETIFTPSTKAEHGEHDININFEETVKIIGESMAAQVKNLSLKIYNKGVELANEKGIIIADTKFEFGIYNDELILIDEILTPDSSRFWPGKIYMPGGSQKSYDKQYVRDYLLSIKWDKTPPGPALPEKIINKTRDKYMEALTQLTGKLYDF